jgi:hypothetical protein
VDRHRWRFLDVTERDTGVEGGGDEGMTQGVGPDPLGDPGATGGSSHDPSCGVTIKTSSFIVDEDRSFAAFAHCQVNGSGGAGSERQGDRLGSLADHGEGAVPAFEAEAFDVGADGLRDSEAVQREQRDQGVVAGASKAGGNEHGPDLVAVEADGVGLVVEPGSADVGRR